MPAKKRRNGEGTIYQRPDGRWAAQIDIGKDENGKRLRRSIVGISYDDVSAQFDIERGRIQMGGGLQPTKVNVGEWLDAWYISAAPRLRPTTRDGYAQAIGRIKRYIGGSKLTGISIKNIHALYAALVKEKLSLATIRKTMNVLNMALTRAVSAHFILYNPIMMFDMPKVEHKEPTVMTINGQRTFTKYCEQKADKDNVYADVFLFILETGLRVGEIMALQWQHVEYRNDQMYIHVKQTAARVSNDSPDAEQKTRINIGKPKTTAGDRLIPATGNAIKILQRRRAAQKIKTEFVFSASTGNMLQERNIRRALGSFCSKLGIKQLTVHELRHTFSTRMYEVGIPSEERAKIMGHADSRTTDRVYVTIDLNSVSNAMKNYAQQLEKLDGGNNMATTMTSSLQPD